MLIGLAVLVVGVFAVLVAVGARRRPRYVPLVMSEDWRRAHAADPVPDHLR